MLFPKVLGVISLVLFGTILFVAVLKSETPPAKDRKQAPLPIEVRLDDENKGVIPAPVVNRPRPVAAKVAIAEPIKKPEKKAEPKATEQKNDDLPDANRVEELFSLDSKLPIVETITYKSRVSWLKGRPAWLSDYASHYQTSRHFIARSLHGKPDYFKQDLAEGDRFNVLRKDKDINFHLLIDTARCKLWLFYHDKDSNERVLLKTYRVCLGRPDSSKVSGLLTPLGKYSLGNKVAIYKPKMMGFHNGERVEMISVFGTRWIPFDKEISGCTATAKGFGIHGVPWVTAANSTRAQDISSIGQYQSDGCVRMASEDVEELFAIIITKPTVVEIVKDYHEANLPGIEKR